MPGPLAVAALSALPNVIGAVGNIFGGRAQTKQHQLDREQREREFNRTQGQSEGQDAISYERMAGSAGLRDQIQAMLMARMGAAPRAFVPRVQGGQGGAEYARQAAQPMHHAAANYQPGQGGVSTDVMQQVMARLGYGNSRPRMRPAPVSPVPHQRRNMGYNVMEDGMQGGAY